MAKKTRCPGCGAKNPATQHRCRVCTTIVNPEAPEAEPRGLAPTARSEAVLEAAAEVNARPFDAEELHPGLADGDPPVLVEQPPTVEPMAGPAPLPEPEPVFADTADLIEFASYVPKSAIEIDVAPLHPEEAPPPLIHESEAFDPDGLVIDPPH